jgi:glycosyltransferase involved in cell wall biosynthesis
MRICLVYQGEYPSPAAERLEKIAQTLSAAGHDVFVLCNNYGSHSQAEERYGNLQVIRFRALFRNRTLNRILYFPVFLNPIWIVQLLLVIRRFRIQAIQVIDIPLALAALAVGRAFGLPVVMDMWENYPEALKGWAKLDWKVRLFKNPAVARAVELFVIPRVNQLFVVVDEQKERLIAEGVPPDRIRVLTNAPDVYMFTSGTASTGTPLGADDDAYKLLYVGVITVERGLEDIIRALPLLRAELPKLRFYIAGTGSHEAYHKRLVESTGVDDLVRFTGWVPFDQIQFYIAQSDLCVIPHVRSKFIDTTIPNKLFQYMLMGKPLLVSDAKPLARVVRESGCGFIFESGRPDSAAAAIRTAHAARGDASIGERGKDCVLRKYTWEKASPVLIDYYRRLEQERAESAPVRTTTYDYTG